MKRTIATLACLVLLAACKNAGSNTTTTDTTATNNAASTTASAASSGKAATEITVTITGGANAGTYTATSSEPTCSEGLTGANSFGNQYSTQKVADNELSSVQLIIADKDEAKAGTDKILFSVRFGKLLSSNSKSYTIDGGAGMDGYNPDAKKEGSGKATLTESDGAKIVTIEGTTKDGVGIKATITCNTMFDAGALGK